jgi:hypothetical protein
VRPAHLGEQSLIVIDGGDDLDAPFDAAARENDGIGALLGARLRQSGAHGGCDVTFYLHIVLSSSN